MSHHELTLGYTSNDDSLRPVRDAEISTHPTGLQKGYVQVTHAWFSGSSLLSGEDRNKVLDVFLNVCGFASGFSSYGVVKPIQQWWAGSWQPVAPGHIPYPGNVDPSMKPVQDTIIIYY